MLDEATDRSVRHDPYLILFQQEADRHTDALTEAGVEFQDVEDCDVQ